MYWHFVPQELQQRYIQEAQQAAESAKEFRERTMYNMAKKIEDIKEKRRIQSEEERQRMDEEIRYVMWQYYVVPRIRTFLYFQHIHRWLKLCAFFRILEAKLDEERNQEELRLAEREAERVAKKVQQAQEQEAAKQLSLAQQGLNEEEKEVDRW